MSSATLEIQFSEPVLKESVRVTAGHGGAVGHGGAGMRRGIWAALLAGLVGSAGMIAIAVSLWARGFAPQARRWDLVQEHLRNLEQRYWDREQLQRSSRGLALLGPEYRAYVVPVLTRMISRMVSERTYAGDIISLLGVLGPPASRVVVPPLDEALGHYLSRQECEAIVEALGRIGEVAPARVVPVLIRCLDREVMDPARIAVLLGKLGAAASPAVPRLTELLLVGHYGERETAEALRNILVSSPAALSIFMVRAFQTNEIHETTTDLLFKVRPVMVSASAAYERGLKNPDPRVRVETCWAVESLGPQAERLAPALAELLRDPEARVRTAAAEAILILDPGRRFVSRETLLAAVPDLEKHEEDECGCRGEARASQKPRYRYVAALLDALSLENEGVQLAALQALGKRPWDARVALPTLEDLAHRSQGAARNVTVAVMANIKNLAR